MVSVGHRQFGRDVAHAEFLEIDGMAVLLDQQDRAGNLAGRDLVADVVADALQFRARETSGGGAGDSAMPAFGASDERRTSSASAAAT